VTSGSKPPIQSLLHLHPVRNGNHPCMNGIYLFLFESRDCSCMVRSILECEWRSEPSDCPKTVRSCSDDPASSWPGGSQSQARSVYPLSTLVDIPPSYFARQWHINRRTGSKQYLKGRFLTGACFSQPAPHITWPAQVPSDGRRLTGTKLTLFSHGLQAVL
jgi:hypothetical protein